VKCINVNGVCCSVWRFTAVCCSELQYPTSALDMERTLILQHTATTCNNLQHTAIHCNITSALDMERTLILQHTATTCNNLQHTAIHCNITPALDVERSTYTQTSTILGSSTAGSGSRVASCNHESSRQTHPQTHTDTETSQTHRF